MPKRFQRRRRRRPHARNAEHGLVNRESIIRLPPTSCILFTRVRSLYACTYVCQHERKLSGYSRRECVTWTHPQLHKRNLPTNSSPPPSTHSVRVFTLWRWVWLYPPTSPLPPRTSSSSPLETPPIGPSPHPLCSQATDTTASGKHTIAHPKPVVVVVLAVVVCNHWSCCGCCNEDYTAATVGHWLLGLIWCFDKLSVRCSRRYMSTRSFCTTAKLYYVNAEQQHSSRTQNTVRPAFS